MAGDPGYMLSEQAVRKLVDDHRRLAHEVYQLKQSGDSKHRPAPWPRELYWGKTLTEGEGHPDTGNTFLVKLIDRTFDETVGDQAVTDTIGGDAVQVEARTVDGCYVPPETIVQVERRLSRQGWRYWILPGPMLYDARVLADFCSGEPFVDCDQLEPYGWCDDSYAYDAATVVQAIPKYNIIGCQYDHVLLLRNPSSATYPWSIIQVTHKLVEAVTGAQYVSCSLQFPKKEISVMHCCPSTSPAIVPMYEHTYYGEVSLVKEFTESMDPQNSTCEVKLKGKTSTFCAFVTQTLGANTTLSTLTLEGIKAGLPVSDDGICLQQATQWIWVLCAADPSTAADLLCLDDCAGGSGSA